MDLTLSIDRKCKKDMLDLAVDLEDFFRPMCQNYVFQLESTGENENKNNHFQCRINLVHEKRMRPGTLFNLIENYFSEGNGETSKNIFYFIDISPTCNATKNFDYCMKEESRISGPWADRETSFLERSIMSEDLLSQWHYGVLNKLKDRRKGVFDWRTIMHIYDHKGNNMKSSFCRYLMYHFPKEVGIINGFGSPAQVNSSLVKMGPKLLYILDLPRSYSWLVKKDGITKRKYHQAWPELANIVEKLKDGMLIDTMYGSDKLLLMAPPEVVILSNWPIAENVFSKDRLTVVNLEHEREWPPASDLLDGNCVESAPITEKRSVYDFIVRSAIESSEKGMTAQAQEEDSMSNGFPF